MCPWEVNFLAFPKKLVMTWVRHTVYVYGHILVGKFFDEFHWRENNYLMGLIDRFGEMMRAAILAMKGHIAGFYTG